MAVNCIPSIARRLGKRKRKYNAPRKIRVRTMSIVIIFFTEVNYILFSTKIPAITPLKEKSESKDHGATNRGNDQSISLVSCGPFYLTVIVGLQCPQRRSLPFGTTKWEFPARSSLYLGFGLLSTASSFVSPCSFTAFLELV